MITNKLICPECSKNSLRSIVRCGQVLVTQMDTDSYYDEDGDWHFHDPNTGTAQYHCSNNHHWNVKSELAPCPTCDEKNVKPL